MFHLQPKESMGVANVLGFRVGLAVGLHRERWIVPDALRSIEPQAVA